ncbi:unnamed protein product [Rhizoctonia solani]|uniref:WW domain-containing oxidoreductase [Mus musculus] n=1 Tax=Rhizoctonia solani TaxID=456999 RepID=A0A8H3BRN4_9AGAM|nr:unnamed protein product [Rhizoctonia solani]
MPYSEHAHYAPVGTVLSKFSAIRNALGNFITPLLPDMPLPSADLHGKQAIITGANSGIGFETAKALARMGAHVVLACRNKDKAETARKDIEQAVQGAQVEVEILDCASLESVRQFVERWSTREFTKIDILVNNAGRILNTRITTVDGYEDTYQANHLSHTLLALSLLKSGYFSPNARIITVSSISFFSSPPLDAHNTNNKDVINQYEEGATLPWETMVLLYSQAKACQAIWSMALQRKLQETEKWKNIVVQACHPGTVKSSMLSQSDGPGGSSGAALNAFKSFVNTFGISNEQGAVVPAWLAVAREPAKPDLRRVLNTRITTIDGYEDTYQANHLSHTLLTLSLLKYNYFSPSARIVTLSSISFFSSPPLDAQNTNSNDIINRYDEGATLPWETMVELYARAKACQAIWSMVLQRKLQETEKWKDIVVQACHPGTVKSSMLSQSDGPGGSSGAALNAFKSFVNTFGISNEQGAVVPVWLAVAREPAQPDLRGLYWDRMRWMWVAPWSMEIERQDRLWNKWCLDAGVSFP